MEKTIAKLLENEARMTELSEKILLVNEMVTEIKTEFEKRNAAGSIIEACLKEMKEGLIDLSNQYLENDEDEDDWVLNILSHEVPADNKLTTGILKLLKTMVPPLLRTSDYKKRKIDA